MREVPNMPKPDITPPPFLHGRVFVHAGLIILLTFIAGVVAGFVAAAQRISISKLSMILGLSNLFMISLGGFFVGLRVPRPDLPRHLGAVGLIVWLFGLLNVFLGYVNIEQFLLSALFIAVSLALGGWIAGLISSNQRS